METTYIVLDYNDFIGTDINIDTKLDIDTVTDYINFINLKLRKLKKYYFFLFPPELLPVFEPLER